MPYVGVGFRGQPHTGGNSKAKGKGDTRHVTRDRMEGVFTGDPLHDESDPSRSGVDGDEYPAIGGDSWRPEEVALVPDDGVRQGIQGQLPRRTPSHSLLALHDHHTI